MSTLKLNQEFYSDWYIIDRVTNLFEDQCRSAMVEYAAQSCCFGNRPANEHIVKSIKPPTTLHVSLKSYS